MLEKVEHKGLALLVLATAQFMVVLDATIVNVALSTIEKALHFSSASQLQWIITAYTLTFGGFLLLGGRLADFFGRRRVFMAGVGLFALSSLAAGLATSPTLLIIFRAIQGLGGALLSPSALSLLLSIFREGPERNKAMGVWSGVAAGGGAVGLLMGGILTQYAGWRWNFLVNVPVAVIVAILAPRFVPRSLPDKSTNRVDYLGAVLATGGLMTLVYGLVKANDYGWGDGRTIAILTAAVAMLVGFILNERFVQHPLMPLRIFKNRSISVANLMQLPITAGMFSVFFYLSIYLQQVLGYSPVKAGLVNLPFSLCIGISATITSKLITRVGPKQILAVSLLFVTAGLYYYHLIPVHGHYLTNILPGIILMASGMGATFVALTLAATTGVAHREAGLASGLLNTSQQIGGAIGLAILTAVSTASTKHAMVLAHGNPASLQTALVHGFKDAFLVATSFALGAWIIGLVGLKARKLSKQDIANEAELEGEAFPVVPGV